MLHIHLNDLNDADETHLASELERVGPELRITISVPDQYIAGSQSELAAGWLVMWYIAEQLAECASVFSCVFEEGARGSGEFELRFKVNNAKEMAARIVEFSAVFDPDNGEAFPFVWDEASDWLEHRGSQKARFPDLEQSYRDDAAACVDDDDE